MKKQTKTKKKKRKTKKEEEGEDEGKLGRGTKSHFLARETFSKRWTEHDRAKQQGQEVRRRRLRLPCQWERYHQFNSLER